jgi:GntR family transcriptional regulator
MGDPMYRQIADDLRRQIESGELSPGAQLPTELELREKYDASRNTIRDALKWLITRGLIETRPGQGRFVVQRIVPFVTTLTGDPGVGGDGDIYLAEVKAALRTPDASGPRVEIQQADNSLAAELRLMEGATVVSRHQERYIDGVPWSLQTSFYPLSLVERGAGHLIEARDIEQGSVRYLSETIGIKQVGYRDTVRVRAPDVTEARFFALPDDGHVPVIETLRTAFDESSAPFRLTVSVYPADRNEFAVNVGQIPAEFAAPPSQGPAQPGPDGQVPDTGWSSELS